jgi:hypothetical protein
LCDQGKKSKTKTKKLFLKKIIHLFTCSYIVWFICPPCPPPPLSSPSLPGKTKKLLTEKISFIRIHNRNTLSRFVARELDLEKKEEERRKG